MHSTMIIKKIYMVLGNTVALLPHSSAVPSLMLCTCLSVTVCLQVPMFSHVSFL